MFEKGKKDFKQALFERGESFCLGYQTDRVYSISIGSTLLL
jgi:hypothetical protein